ncbi:MAG: transposase [Methylocella sp.]
MAQHFLMSAAARTLSLIDLCDLSEDAAHKMLCEMRWEDTDGDPVCPHCSCPAVYTYRCRRVFKCKACHRQFSATSGTLLAYRKLPFRTLLMALSLFVNAAKGLSSLQLSRNLGLHAKTAFVLLHKLRCALTSNSAATILSAVVEIDGGWFGAHIRPENYRVARIDRRRIDHGQAYSANGACTNLAESYISRLRRSEIGQHYHIAGPHLGQYAGTVRQNRRRICHLYPKQRRLDSQLGRALAQWRIDLEFLC